MLTETDPIVRASHGCTEEKAFLVEPNLRAIDVRMQVPIQVVVAGHFVALAAFLVQTHPSAPPLDVDIFNPHFKRGCDTGEGKYH